MPTRHANLLKQLLAVNTGPVSELLKKGEDTNLNGLLEKEISKRDE